MAKRHVINFVITVILGLAVGRSLWQLWDLPDEFFHLPFWGVILGAALGQTCFLLYEIVICLHANRSREVNYE